MSDFTVPDLRRFTMARVGLGRTGNSIATRDVLAFQLAHARARDAVHGLFDPYTIATELETAPVGQALSPVCAAQAACNDWRPLVVRSAAHSREEYLRRPDLGRALDARSRESILKIGGPFDVIFIVADGLSPLAVQSQGVPLLRLLTNRLEAAEWRIAPVVIASQGRVALSDEIGSMAQASLAVMLIGERPGLSAADSMGVYLTWSPQPGRTDAERNCISNIRPGGLSIDTACELLLLLIREARAKRLSGVTL